MDLLADINTYLGRSKRPAHVTGRSVELWWPHYGSARRQTCVVFLYDTPIMFVCADALAMFAHRFSTTQTTGKVLDSIVGALWSTPRHGNGSFGMSGLWVGGAPIAKCSELPSLARGIESIDLRSGALCFEPSPVVGGVSRVHTPSGVCYDIVTRDRAVHDAFRAAAMNASQALAPVADVAASYLRGFAAPPSFVASPKLVNMLGKLRVGDHDGFAQSCTYAFRLTDLAGRLGVPPPVARIVYARSVLDYYTSVGFTINLKMELVLGTTYARHAKTRQRHIIVGYPFDTTPASFLDVAYPDGSVGAPLHGLT